MPMVSSLPDLKAVRDQLFGKPGRPASIVLAIVGLLAISGPAVLVTAIDWKAAPRRMIARKMPVIPSRQLPPVDPVKLVAVTAREARSINAAIPFSEAPNPAARPFRLDDTGPAAARAIDCLATAVLYEAGDDSLGQRAVAQVVINRARHPAFPKSICGVVFQGSERRTGCQFTFTCDGALYRHRWSDAAWRRAREVATRALNGQVFAPVGHATHYHTDWVVPYWSSSLDKVTAVGSHLFLRWTGWWGTPSAFNRRVATDEPFIPVLGGGGGQQGGFANNGTGVDDAANRKEAAAALMLALGSKPATPMLDNDGIFLFTIDRGTPSSALGAIAVVNCGDRAYCKFMAWSSKGRTPAALPLSPAQVASMSFSYLRDRARRFEKALWNCDQFPRPDRSQCMKAQTFQPGASEEPPRQAVDTGLPFGPAASIADPLGSRTTKAIARPRVGGALLPSGSAPEPAPNPAATATP